MPRNWGLMDEIVYRHGNYNSCWISDPFTNENTANPHHGPNHPPNRTTLRSLPEFCAPQMPPDRPLPAEPTNIPTIRTLFPEPNTSSLRPHAPARQNRLLGCTCCVTILSSCDASLALLRRPDCCTLPQTRPQTGERSARGTLPAWRSPGHSGRVRGVPPPSPFPVGFTTGPPRAARTQSSPAHSPLARPHHCDAVVAAVSFFSMRSSAPDAPPGRFAHCHVCLQKLSGDRGILKKR